jgi:hypothetical protein
MPVPIDKLFRVFYSWQSDLPVVVNQKLIRNALNSAGTTLTADQDLNLRVLIDEATRDVPGSPDIADSIFSKIREADVFVCDLTKVAEIPNEAGENRRYCNPNAALELGYALRVLGWNRIILVFNLAYGILPDDLPFDARGKRALPYRCKFESDEKQKPTETCKTAIKGETGQLRAVLIDALRIIARDNPKRPHALEAMSPQEIKRERDLEQLGKAFYWINLTVMDDFIQRLASRGRLTHTGTDFCDALSELLGGAAFHINDGNLRRRVVNFVEAWKKCSRYAAHMEAGPKEGYFRMAGDIPASAEQAKQLEFTMAQAKPLRGALNSLLKYVREHYLEIDPSISGREAVRADIEYRKKTQDAFGH